MTGTPLTLHIEPRPNGQPIAGRLRDSCGEEHHFTGWLGLLTLLEQARLKQAPKSGGSRTEVSR
jgi:hypothetical protein